MGGMVCPRGAYHELMTEPGYVMEKKLFGLCVLLCLDLVMLVAYVEKTSGQEAPASTTFYENVIAITFDDGPHSQYTVMLLDGLKERQVKGTFFVLGEKIAGNEEIIRRMHDEGHLIGNHTFSHVALTSVSVEEAKAEVDRTNAAIEAVTGVPVRYLRPPYGAFSDELEGEIDLDTVLWSVDPRDWDTSDVDSIVAAVVSSVKDGDIILLHDVYPSSVAAALRIVDELQDRGFVFVTVDDLVIR